MCPEGKHGDSCNETCNCVIANTDTCNAVTGTCTCKSGWEGATCDTDTNECNNATVHNCSENSECRNIDGSFYCLCNSGFSKSSDGSCQGMVETCFCYFSRRNLLFFN